MGQPLYDWKGNKQGSLTSGSGASSGAPPSMTPCVSTTSGLSTATGPSPLARENAREGHWEDGPGMELLHALQKSAPSWSSLRRTWGPGARSPAVRPYLRHPRHEGDGVRLRPRGESAYLPHNCQRDSVIYTGTHDTPTFLQWLRETDPDSRLFASRYLRLRQDEGLGWGVISGAWAAPSRLAIAPPGCTGAGQRRSDEHPRHYGQPELELAGPSGGLQPLRLR